MPLHKRFAKPPADITASVQRMRSLIRARRAYRTRSWEASISLFRSFKVPQFERFKHPIGDVRTAVLDMRERLSAQRAAKKMSLENVATSNPSSKQTGDLLEKLLTRME